MWLNILSKSKQAYKKKCSEFIRVICWCEKLELIGILIELVCV